MESQLPNLLRSQSDFVDEYEASERAKINAQQCRDRRASILGQRISQDHVNLYTRPVHYKDEGMRALIRSTLLSNDNMQVLVGHLSEDALNALIDAFYVKHFDHAVDIICQGHEGDCLYVIASGHVDIYVARP